MTTPTDPLYADQWHLTLIGDIERIWDDYTGAGVQVGVYDDGVDYTHEDLDDNYDSSLQVEDDQGQEVDPFPVNYIPAPFPRSDAHGTAVAGIIAGEANGVGGTGVSYGASVTGVNIFGTDVYGNVNGATDEFIAVVLQGVAFDISQNSWGATPFQTADASLAGNGFAADLEDAYAVLSSDGRGGLGTVITQAAGNDGLDANRDGINASRYTITVAATDEQGNVQSYSNYGSSILVAAPAAAVTTDLAGVAGTSDGDYMDDFGGTSAATPVVSGVVALMLEANPDLGWRDVQNILAASASLTGSDLGGPATGFEDGAWYVNGDDNWNGGGMHVHTSYGFGMVNAYNAVRMAEVWSLFYPIAATSENEQVVSSGTRTLGGAGGLAIPDSSASTVSFTLTIEESISIEHVALTLDIDSQRIGDLRVVLISPEGTEVDVVLNSNQVRTSADGEWVYGIEGLRGELSAGTWTVEITDMRENRTSTVSSASLEVYGSTPTTDDVHHITDEFLVMVDFDASRAVVTDTNGGTDWLNFAAVAGSVNLSLVAGQTFSVDGAVWGSLSAGSSFENIVAGDGDDTLTGNNGDNVIYGMRGNDVLNGGDGDDVVSGDVGNDVLSGGIGLDSLAGGAGNDRLDGGTDADVMSGEQGRDTYVVDHADDSIENEMKKQDGGGFDRVESSVSANLATGTEMLVLTGDAEIAGAGRKVAPDGVIGNGADNYLSGWGGDDGLHGKAGDDVLHGGAGWDWLTGAAGADTFVYLATGESAPGWVDRDVIHGFEPQTDAIDLHAIDANTLLPGNQAFAFIGTDEFSGQGVFSAGELRDTKWNDRNFTLLEMDTDGDGVADMQIFVTGTSMVSAGDFLL